MLLCERISYSTERISRKIFCFSRTFFSLSFSLPRRISIFTTAFSRAFFFSLSLSLSEEEKEGRRRRRRRRREKDRKKCIFFEKEKKVCEREQKLRNLGAKAPATWSSPASRLSSTGLPTFASRGKGSGEVNVGLKLWPRF